MKKLLLTLLGVLMALPMLARDFTYEYEGQTLTYTVIDEDAKTCMTTRGNSISGKLVIPSTAINGEVEYKVIAIGDNCFANSDLGSITLPEGLETIGERAFYGCSSLTSIEIPNSVTSISSYAFSGCRGLTSFEIPSTVTTIGFYAFDGCRGLTSIVIPGSVRNLGPGAFHDCVNLRSVKCDSLTPCEIDESTFDETVYVYATLYVPEGCLDAYLDSSWSRFLNITDVDILQFTYEYEGQTLTYTVIDEDAKTCMIGLNNRGLRGDIIIPPTVVSNNTKYEVIGIGAQAFAGSQISEIILPASITSIGSKAFSECNNLRIVGYSSETPCDIQEDTFSSYTYLNVRLLVPIGCEDTYRQSSWGRFSEIYETEFTFVESFRYEYEGQSVIYCVTDEDTRTCSVYFGNSEIRGNLIIPEEVEYLGIQYTVTSIEQYAFGLCIGLTSIEIPSTVTTIGDSAFQGCSSLTSIEIPNSVTSIGQSAFYDCDAIRTVFYNTETPCEIDESTFSMVVYENATLYVPGGCLDTYLDSSWNRFLNITYKDMLHFTYEYEGQTLTYAVIDEDAKTCGTKRGTITVPGNEVSGDLKIPAKAIYGGVEYSVTTIGSFSFFDCESMTSVEIPSTVTTIGDEAFYGCSSLASIEIPNSVTTIGDSAFRDCTGLTSVEVPSSVTKIGSEAFDGCSSLCSIEIPASVKDIGRKAFNKCPIPYYFLPKDAELGVCVFGNNGRITEIVIEDGRESIYGSWFGDGLKSLKIPDSVTSYVNYNISEGKTIIVTSYTIGKGLKNIPTNAFDRTSTVIINNLTPPTLDKDVFGDKAEPANILAVVPHEAISAYKNNAMWSKMTILDETDAVTVTLDGSEALSVALYNQTGKMPGNVLKLKIKGNITEDDWNQFEANMINCIELELSEASSEIFPAINREYYRPFECPYFPAGVKIVNNHTTPVVKAIPETVEVIGESAFESAVFEGNPTLPAGVRSIGDRAFANTQLTEVAIPDACEKIGGGAFMNCRQLKSATLGAGARSIGGSAFANTLLEEVVIPDACETIGSGAFKNCSNLKSISLGNGVQTIEDEAFANTAISSILFPAAVSSIGPGALQNTKLNWIASLNTVPPTLAENFNTSIHYQNCALIIPSDSFFDYLQAPVWGRFAVLEGRLDYTSGIGATAECEIADNKENEAPALRRAEAAVSNDNMMPVANGQAIVMEKGKVLRFKISTAQGTNITKVLFNDEDVTDKLVNGIYTTPKIDGRASLKIETDGVGIATTVADAVEAEFYTLQGMRVVRPEAGQIYIVRKGGRAYKTIVK